MSDPQPTRQLGSKLTQKLAAAVDAILAFPRSVRRILELTRNVDYTPKDLGL